MPTILDACDIPLPEKLSGRSFWGLLTGNTYQERSKIFAQKTFHTSYAPNRCIRTKDFKYIRNFECVRSESIHGDSACKPDWIDMPLLSPADELYDLREDPLECANRAGDLRYASIKKEMQCELLAWMKKTNDPLLKGPIASPVFYKNLKAFTEGACND
jgi:arylsulfatase A-like enzyme